MHKIKGISGCQTGADQAFLSVCELFGLETGGYVTQGNRTQNGDRLDLIERFHLTELPNQDYRARTWKNVEISDATLRIYYDRNSPGELCTMKAIRIYNKPYIDVNLNNPVSSKLVAKWIESQNISILNGAGNSERTSPGITKVATEYLIQVFTYTYGKPNANFN